MELPWVVGLELQSPGHLGLQRTKLYVIRNFFVGFSIYTHIGINEKTSVNILFSFAYICGASLGFCTNYCIKFLHYMFHAGKMECYGSTIDMQES